MKKLVQTAELYVEWVALALGGVFLLLMMFLYLLSAPVSKELGTRKVTLSDVDRVIYEDQTRLLDEAMSKNVEVSLAVKPFAAAFKETLAMKEAKSILIDDDRRWIGIPAAPIIIVPDETGKTTVNPALVNKLPEPLPAPEWHSASTGRSVIPAPIVPGAVVAPGSAFAPIPVAGQGLPLGIDKLWVTEAFSIPTQKIADAFAEAQIPAGLPTAILALELIREEQLSDGQWGHRALIKPLATPQMLSFPAEGNLTDETTYLDWANKNTSTLTLPIFHVVVAGEKWYPPGQPNPNLPGAVDPTGRTPLPGPGPSVPRTGGRRRPLPAAADPRPAAFDMFAQAAPSRWSPAGQMPPGYPPGAMPGGGYQDPSITRQGVGTPISAVPAGFTVPNGNFVPSDLKKNIFVWAHDDTVEPEKVYRYKLRYRLKSPVYRSNAVDPKKARQFSLVSTESDWSDPVVVPPVVYVFLASGVTTNTTSAKFDVLRWQNGKWQKKSFTAEPGDIIGGEVKDTAMDFTTGYSLVDMKLDVVTHDPKVVLSNRTGELTTHSLRIDQSEIITVQKQVGYTDPIPVPKTGTPGGPGMSPGMPGWMSPR